MITAVPIALIALGLHAPPPVPHEPAPEPAAAPEEPFGGNACIECHRDLPGRSSEIVHVEWRQSVHYAAGVACDDCHGGNASLTRDAFDSTRDWKEAAHARRDTEFLVLHQPDPMFVSSVRGRSVSYFCGKCHADIKEKHLGSPHGDFGDPTCLYCHGSGSHRITPPTIEILDTRSRAEGGRCSPCHEASSMETLKRIKATLQEAEEHIAVSGEQYQELQDWGYRNLELEEMHSHAKETQSHLRQVFHSFNLLEISNFVGEIEGVADRTSDTHALIDRLRAAKRRQAAVGSLVVVMLLALAGLLHYYKHEFLSPEPHAPAQP